MGWYKLGWIRTERGGSMSAPSVWTVSAQSFFGSSN